MQWRIQMSLVTEDVIINWSQVLKRLEEKNILKCFRWPILYGNNSCSKYYSFKKLFSSSYLENAMGSAVRGKPINNQIMQWKTINRADKANILSKHFWVRITIWNTKNFLRRSVMVANIFSGVFFVRGHWISNLNPEICRRHVIIIAFGEDSIEPMESYWCVMTTRSCSFDRSQCRKFQMGYDYESGQQVHLLVKNPLDTSCQLLVTWLFRGHELLKNRNNSSYGWATVVKSGQLQKL